MNRNRMVKSGMLTHDHESGFFEEDNMLPAEDGRYAYRDDVVEHKTQSSRRKVTTKHKVGEEDRKIGRRKHKAQQEELEYQQQQQQQQQQHINMVQNTERFQKLNCENNLDNYDDANEDHNDEFSNSVNDEHSGERHILDETVCINSDSSDNSNDNTNNRVARTDSSKSVVFTGSYSQLDLELEEISRIRTKGNLKKKSVFKFFLTINVLKKNIRYTIPQPVEHTLSASFRH